MIQYDDLVRWSDLTPDQQGSIGNGCGPSLMPRALKKVMPGVITKAVEWVEKAIKWALFDWFHSASCDRHDFAHRRGGTEKHRRISDDGFRAAMKVDANRMRGIRRIIAKAQASIYYRLVRWFGWMFFHYGSPRSISEILK